MNSICSPQKMDERLSHMTFGTPPSPLPHPTIFWSNIHEMILRKSTINNNLKSSKNPSKICVKKFIFSKFAGLQACRLRAGNFTIKWTPSQLFFNSILSSPHAPAIYWLKHPPSPSNSEEPPWSGGPVPPCSQHLWETLLMEILCYQPWNNSFPLLQIVIILVELVAKLRL